MVTPPGDADAAVSAEVASLYRRFSLFNSPYPAHDAGCAVDLYPESNVAPSPVAGEVLETLAVRCPTRSYAGDRDHLVVVDCEGSDLVARVLHVEPAVEPGNRVDVGDPLGEMVRSGFFGQWVDNHVHLDFRPNGANHRRAAGAVPVAVDVPVDPLAWDGTGTVVETGPTHALLDAPAHPAPGERFAALAADDGTVLDGGLVHYAGGGVLRGPDGTDPDGPVELLGTRVGTADGRRVRWADVDVLANGRRITGLSLFAARDAGYGAKLVCPDRKFAVGEEVRVTIRPSDDPVRLGRGK